MLTIVNTLNKKRIQKNQELKELEAKKSDKEIQFVHPPIRAQRNRVPKREILDDLMFSPYIPVYPCI